MFQYCGRRFRVYKRAHKSCATMNATGGRWLTDGIHLENLRCDGKEYGGWQAAWLIFWKAAWLKSVEGASPTPHANAGRRWVREQTRSKAECTEEAVLAGTLAKDQPTDGVPKYACQATDLPIFTTYLPWWDARQYVRDYTSGNVTLGRLISGAVYVSYYYLV